MCHGRNTSSTVAARFGIHYIVVGRFQRSGSTRFRRTNAGQARRMRRNEGRRSRGIAGKPPRLFPGIPCIALTLESTRNPYITAFLPVWLFALPGGPGAAITLIVCR